MWFKIFSKKGDPGQRMSGIPPHSGRRTLTKRFTMKLTAQSEMKMETGCRPAGRRHRRVSQASWWFGQMRRAAEHASPAETGTGQRVEQRALLLGMEN
jgi:hypothetical protein